MKYLILPAILPLIGLSGTLALAHGPGMMSGMSGRGMQGCMQMMEGMNGGSQVPNEQWRREQLSPGGKERGSAPPGSLSRE